MKHSPQTFEPAKRLHPLGRHRMSGMTLLELTVVILVLLTLISILFVGAQAWKRGTDRSCCLMNIRNIQQAVRSYSNMYNYAPGMNVPGLVNEVFGNDKFMERIPTCPSGPAYTFGNDTIPPMGSLYAECDYKTSLQHVPADYGDW